MPRSISYIDLRRRMRIIICSAVQTRGKNRSPEHDFWTCPFSSSLFPTFTWEIRYFIYLVSGVRFTISVILAGLSCRCVRGNGFLFQKEHISIDLSTLPTRRYVLPARSSYTDYQKEFVPSSNNATESPVDILQSPEFGVSNEESNRSCRILEECISTTMSHHLIHFFTKIRN